MNTDIDIQKIEELKELFQSDFDKQLNIFLDNTQSYLGKIEISLKENDYANVREIAHKIFAGTAQYGAILVSQLARELEYSDEKILSAAGDKMLTRMKEEFEKYRTFIS